LGLEVSWREYVDMRFADWERSHKVQFRSTEKALALASETLKDRLAQMNEFRQQIDVERATYVRREQMDESTLALTQRLERLEQWQANVLGRQVVFGGAIIVISGLITLALRFVGH